MKQPEIAIRIAGQSAEMPVQAQAEACLARAWCRCETKDIMPTRVSVYRLRWTILALALVSATGNVGAAPLTAVVPAGRSGVIGATNNVVSALSGRMSDYGGAYELQGFPSVSAITDICTLPSDTEAALGSRGTWGFSLAGTTPGGVLLVDGTGQWTRIGLDGRALNGTVVFLAGTWTNNWGPGSLSNRRSLKSNQDGLFELTGALSGGIACPVADADTGGAHGVRRAFMPDSPKSSSLNVRFLIDAPAGGLTPGRYTSPPLYHIDSDPTEASLDLYRMISPGVVVTAAYYGCTLTAPASVNLDNMDHLSTTIPLAVRCSDGAEGPEPMTAWLSVMASGTSRGVSADPQQLGVAGTNETLYLRGSWSATVPSCTASDMYFDGRDGLSLGQVLPGQNVDFGKIPVSFRLCTTPSAKPGNYTAQATLSVVQR
ncbi:Uncharacterised protein [Cedecea lapagei]|uniref:Fimbrial protein n=1 Tax=Cedecea lapagei TaxID=158823 RepID=A0A447V7K8_9ENTR|nr:Uncharacterised protein [Cedecea lapagei]